MAAFVIGTRSVTLLPHPTEGASREDIERAVRESPRFLRLLEAWRWSSPLWRQGVISGALVAAADQNDQSQADLAGIYGEIRNDPDLAELRPITRAADALADEQPAAFLDSLSSDLLRGGPDPGISIPVNATIERISRTRGLVLVRGEACSVAQRAESRLGERIFSIGVPVLAQAGAHRILLLRNDLAGTLRELRAAIVRSFERSAPCDTLAPAVSAYVSAFREWSEGRGGRSEPLGRGDDETGRRIVPAFVAITGMSMPADAVLQSSRVAARSVGGYSAVSRSRPTARDQGCGAPAAERPPTRQPTLIVRATNIAPERPTP